MVARIAVAVVAMARRVGRIGPCRVRRVSPLRWVSRRASVTSVGGTGNICPVCVMEGSKDSMVIIVVCSHEANDVGMAVAVLVRPVAGSRAVASSVRARRGSP